MEVERMEVERMEVERMEVERMEVERMEEVVQWLKDLKVHCTSDEWTTDKTRNEIDSIIVELNEIIYGEP
jgi:hypothetical protein